VKQIVDDLVSYLLFLKHIFETYLGNVFYDDILWRTYR